MVEIIRFQKKNGSKIDKIKKSQYIFVLRSTTEIEVAITTSFLILLKFLEILSKKILLKHRKYEYVSHVRIKELSS